MLFFAPPSSRHRPGIDSQPSSDKPVSRGARFVQPISKESRGADLTPLEKPMRNAFVLYSGEASRMNFH